MGSGSPRAPLHHPASLHLPDQETAGSGGSGSQGQGDKDTDEEGRRGSSAAAQLPGVTDLRGRRGCQGAGGAGRGLWGTRGKLRDGPGRGWSPTSIWGPQAHCSCFLCQTRAASPVRQPLPHPSGRSLLPQGTRRTPPCRGPYRECADSKDE